MDKKEKYIPQSVVMGSNDAYESYIKGMIEIVEVPTGKGHDINIPGPIESRYFLDFLYEALRRQELYKEVMKLAEGLVVDFETYKKEKGTK